MNKGKTSRQDSEWTAIERAYTMLAHEVGHVMASTVIFSKIVANYGSENARHFLQNNGRAFPILSTMMYEDGPERIDRHIADLNKKLLPFFERKTDIVCIGAEAAWLDIAAAMYGNKTFHVVPHSSDADRDRFLSYYGENVRILNSVDLTHLYGTTSVIVTFAFGVTDHTFFTYPVVYRICGWDTRQSFSEIIALDIIESPLLFYPTDLVEVDIDEMTHVFSRSIESTRRDKRWMRTTL